MLNTATRKVSGLFGLLLHALSQCGETSVSIVAYTLIDTVVAMKTLSCGFHHQQKLDT